MGLQYRKAKVVLNYRETKPQMYKLVQLTYPAVTSEQLIAECANSCGVNPAQTKAVIDALVDRIAHYMEIGHGVKMGHFGSFKPVFTSKVAETLEETTPETIRKKKIMFFPGKIFKDMLQELSISSAGEAIDVKDETSGGGGEG
jgi:predicted histone-like DNA-binding protein